MMSLCEAEMFEQTGCGPDGDVRHHGEVGVIRPEAIARCGIGRGQERDITRIALGDQAHARSGDAVTLCQRRLDRGIEGVHVAQRQPAVPGQLVGQLEPLRELPEEMADDGVPVDLAALPQRLVDLLGNGKRHLRHQAILSCHKVPQGGGLNKSQRILQDHGGTITVDSVLTRGTAFTICLPPSVAP